MQKLFLFRGLRAEQIAELIKDLPEPKRFARGELIYDASRYERAVGVFLTGRGVAESDGVVRNRFAQGAAFGAAAVFGANGKYVSRIRAETDCLVQLLPEAFLKRCIRTEPVCAENYAAFLSEKIRYLNHKIRQYTAPDASVRLYRYLSDLSGGEGRVRLKNASEAARRLGMGRTSLYRALQKLEQSGAIRREGEFYRIEREEL